MTYFVHKRSGETTWQHPGAPQLPIEVGIVVELTGLRSAPELNGRRAVVTADLGNKRWELIVCTLRTEAARRLSAVEEKIRVVHGPPGAVRLRFRNTPPKYSSERLRQDFIDEEIPEGEDFDGLVYDEARNFAYVMAASEQAATRIVLALDGREHQDGHMIIQRLDGKAW